MSDLIERSRLAMEFSRNFAAAKPDIGLTEKEHIVGLGNALERLLAEHEALLRRVAGAPVSHAVAIMSGLPRNGAQVHVNLPPEWVGQRVRILAEPGEVDRD